jgi:hypothetical protein
MNQEQIIKQAAELAKEQKFKGIIIGLADGNFFFVKEASDVNAVINHCKSVKTEKGEPAVHVMDFAQEKPTHKAVDFKDLTNFFFPVKNEGSEGSTASGSQGSEDLLAKASTGDVEALKQLSFEELSTLTVKELRELAEACKIDLGNISKKADIITVLMDDTPAEVDPVELETLSIEQLKEMAQSEKIEFAEDVTKEKLIELIAASK